MSSKKTDKKFFLDVFNNILVRDDPLQLNLSSFNIKV
jgi:hypothetical protein